eukprot:CAMPEP_0184362892 /NCGR_PEP_ID=MMETSP1089-20130417/137049_2 /TAXON_ID=38269 ORGANISM="Gloeochaete wittrockiana, Strain SAG46.84" /NCGR_SAMPLE_ID=MMETSP1089 /ASSEMBLY_ACC=CAM_ASM_000445 /LENGTH=70 /DNA_ID=CAMNT_0026703169 /DNA_START=35 /DNA_END=243 /DNA_ORIENTATION=-
MRALGTKRPESISEKKVEKEESLERAEASWADPSGRTPCSRQNSSQHAFPTWMPAWPMCSEMISLMVLSL